MGPAARWFLVGTVAALIAAGWWARRQLVIVDVDGQSMEPTFRDGDRVLVRRIGPGQARVGQVIMLAPPAEPGVFGPGRSRLRTLGRIWVVKRLAAGPGQPVPGGLAPALTAAAPGVVPEAHLVVLGDNPPESHDSRQEGFIPEERVRGVVVCRIHR
jgi:signal peptidase I